MYKKPQCSALNEKFPSEECSDDGHNVESLFLLDHDRKDTKSASLSRHLPWIGHGTSILICCALLLYTLTLHHESRKSCLERFNAYSPLLEAIDNDYQDVRFKYSLWYQSPFKGPPTPQIEEAWHSIMQYGEISVPASDILRIGHNLTAARYPSSIGGGDYPVIASGTHALHCLHYIWQDHYIAVLPKVEETKAQIPEMYERHYEHCVDYIRQYLMCKFDATAIPLNWVRTHQNPTPNGNTMHKCVDWERLQGWLRERAVEMPEGFQWRQPADAVPLDQNP